MQLNGYNMFQEFTEIVNASESPQGHSCPAPWIFTHNAGNQKFKCYVELIGRIHECSMSSHSNFTARNEEMYLFA